MSPLLKKKEKPAPPPVTKVLYRGDPGLVAEIDQAAKVADISRNEAMSQLLRLGLDANKDPKPKKKT